MNESNIREIARLEIILDVVNATLNRAKGESYQTTVPEDTFDADDDGSKAFVINKKGGAVFVNETKIEKYKDKESIPKDILNSKEYKKLIEDGTLEEVNWDNLRCFLENLKKEEEKETRIDPLCKPIMTEKIDVSAIPLSKEEKELLNNGYPKVETGTIIKTQKPSKTKVIKNKTTKKTAKKLIKKEVEYYKK